MTFTHCGILVCRHDVPFASFYWSDDLTGFAGSAPSEQETRDGIDMQILARGTYDGLRLHPLHGGGHEAVKPGMVRLW